MTIRKSNPADALPTRERILLVAPDVLRRFTLTKFAMEDVARAAGIARQTIYKHFSGRDDLLIAMLVQDMRLRQAPKLADVLSRPPSVENLIEIFMTERQVGGEFPLFTEMLDPNIAPKIAELIFRSDSIAQAREATWVPILRRYAEHGIVRPDIDVAAAVRWITYQMFWLLTHPTVLCDNDATLREYVGQFILGGLLVQPFRGPQER